MVYIYRDNYWSSNRGKQPPDWCSRLPAIIHCSRHGICYPTELWSCFLSRKRCRVATIQFSWIVALVEACWGTDEANKAWLHTPLRYSKPIRPNRGLDMYFLIIICVLHQLRCHYNLFTVIRVISNFFIVPSPFFIFKKQFLCA